MSTFVPVTIDNCRFNAAEVVLLKDRDVDDLQILTLYFSDGHQRSFQGPAAACLRAWWDKHAEHILISEGPRADH